MLALAVVAEGGGLEHAGRPTRLDGAVASSLERLAPTERRDREARQRAGTPSRARRCWVTCRTWPPGRTGTNARRRRRRRRGDVLELEGHHVDAAGEGAHRRRGRRRRRRSRRRPPGRSACRRRARACARGSPSAGPRSRTSGRAVRCRARRAWRREARCGSRQAVFAHRAGLRLAERPEAARPARAARWRGSPRRAGRRSSRPACRWRAWRPARRRASARSRAANRGRSARRSAPARRAPAAMVCAATMPGRCAAPPAPAMITFRPWPSAPGGEFGHPLRRAVGRHDLLQVGHAELVEHGGRVRHRVPVGLDPMMTATSGAGTVGGSGKRTAYQRRGSGLGSRGSARCSLRMTITRDFTAPPSTAHDTMTIR